ncbi:hypothetical protein BDY17DRAFT_252649, partial [Neohortaea acidophila]
MPLLHRRRSARDLVSNNTLANEGGHDVQSPSNDRLSPAPRPATARPVSEYTHFPSRLSHEVHLEDVLSEKHDDERRPPRFSLRKFRNYSEPALAVKAREMESKEKENIPPMPQKPATHPVPSILRTAPTMPADQGQEQENTEDGIVGTSKRPSFFKRSVSTGQSPDNRSIRRARKSTDERRSERAKSGKSTDESRSEKKASSLRWRKLQGRSTGLDDLQKLASAKVATQPSPPPVYGDETHSALALPVFPRSSESGTSEDSNASSDRIYGSTTTTTHTVSTHTTFFKLPRRNRNRNSLFPLPPNAPDLLRRRTESPRRPPRSITNAPLPKPSLAFAEPGRLIRNNSELSRGSSTSSPLAPPRFGKRDRASTTSSLGRSSYDMGTPSLGGSGRNSTSTNGRSSLGALLTMSRFRGSSDPHSPHHDSPGSRSKSNSFAISREALVVPEREEGDTPGKYLERLEAAVARSMIAGILSKSADPFAQNVLRSYTRRFVFFGEPIDMSLRKFLLEADLPKETQQVDRVIQAFADRYHECNPGIFVSPDQAYIIAFSLMMLHTDAFNKNNKRKMQKQDYIKNTSGQSVSDDVLGCFYDNICYTPFVHFEEEVDINGERVLPFKPKKNKLKGAVPESGKKPTGPVDPYNLLVDQKLDMLRPAIKESVTLDDPYNYRTPQTSFDPQYLQRAFTHTGVLQIISQRSRPSAYEGQFLNGGQPSVMQTQAQPGIIDIKITKVGTLWRKATKKKKARSPWQEWGAILTGSQLYLFKNAHWAKGLVHQFTAAQKHGHPRIPVVFKPPLQEFKPDALIKTENAVALVDATYTRHKNAFTFVRPGGLEEVLLADNESELNDWLALINYAAAFRAAGVRIRGMVGGAEEDLRRADIRRLESTQSARSVQTAASDADVSLQRGALSPQLERQVMAARRQIMVQKVNETAQEINETSKELDNMLRNARHLLILAPIAPRTREGIIHAAAHADASIKWTRRDIWRLKCHKDLLALDVQQDGLSASELEVLSEHQQITEPSEPVRKSRPSVLKRLTSKATGSKSPPQSPTSAMEATLERPTTMSSLDTYISPDVFRAPPESTVQEGSMGDWRIPPVQLDVLHEHHRGSVTSTLLSGSSHRRPSVSNASTMSSLRPGEETLDRRPSSVADDSTTVEKLARTATPSSPEHQIMSALDGPTNTTPENKHKSGNAGGVRRGLQKTLRDGTHHQHAGTTPGSSNSKHHHHRRGRESDSTIKSTSPAGAASAGGDASDGAHAQQEGTPGLKRETRRFILHGKQASVVQFGNEW